MYKGSPLCRGSRTDRDNGLGADMMKRNIIALMGALVLAALAVYQNFAAADKEAALPKETAPKPNFLAPAFSLAGLDDRTYSVGGKRDKPIFLNFWASWCGPCEIEAPDLKRLHDKYGEKIDFYAVNMTQYDKLANVRAFAERFGFDFPILLDKEGEAADLYNVVGIPTSFIIDKNGVIVDAFNLLNPDELEKRVKRAVSGS